MQGSNNTNNTKNNNISTFHLIIYVRTIILINIFIKYTINIYN